MKRLFLDANVLFTATHNPKGKAALVIELASSGYWDVITSAYAVEEARRNLLRKFPRHLHAFEALLVPIRVTPSPRGLDCPLPLRDKDRPIFEAPLAYDATHLLTGDLRDFGPFMNNPEHTRGVVIQTVAEFLQGIE
ncbi:MAG: DNA-binding protein [Pseudomonadota bacterium]|nr:DNA-binding protein [Pseudomonadota bacterium]